MATIVRERLRHCADPWSAIVGSTRTALRTIAVVPRDAIVLVPFAQLLPLARRAFGGVGGFLPRIETTQTLARSLGPPAFAEAGQPSMDATLDLLTVAGLLRAQRWGAAWARRDPRGFERATASVVEAAHAMLRAAAAVPPGLRADHWAAAREPLRAAAGPGGSERLLARVALEWSASASPPATDRLFDLRPGAWIVVQAGGSDALTERLLSESPSPAFVIDADADDAAPFELRPSGATPPAVALCDSFEHEAQCAAAQVVDHLGRGETPVALIAQDRVLVRRVRALLESAGVPLLDETGWRLSTTRAAALTMSLLRAARPGAPTDALLDWLKALPDRDAGFAASLDVLEGKLREHRVARMDDPMPAFDAAPAGPDAVAPSGAARLWRSAAKIRADLHTPAQRPLARWLDALREALVACEAWAALEADAAGQQVIGALRLSGDGQVGAAWRLAATDATLGLGGFIDWVDGALERASFIAEPSGAESPPVIVTPLARAMLRPFAAIVVPGADDRHLGAPVPMPALLDEALATAIGVPDARALRRHELRAFGQLLRTPRLTLLRRRADGVEPLADSPLVARLKLALARAGTPAPAWRDPRATRDVEPTPIFPGAPAAGDWLPARLSASACEALRSCPYRFFALNLLRLGEDQELDGEVEKRDYGDWIHAVLDAFHTARAAPGRVENEVAALHVVADAGRIAKGIAEADFVPFAASFASFAPRYVAWLHERDAAGWRWQAGELDVVIEPDGFDGTRLRGRIDRIDRMDRADVAGAATQLIDYKTGSADGLKKKVREPLEDTQLAFYAALLPATAPIDAIYLALDGSQGIEAIRHPDVRASADALREGLGGELRRIRSGAGLPPLGEPPVCDYCAARGLCRRDHWSQPEHDAATDTGTDTDTDTDTEASA